MVKENFERRVGAKNTARFCWRGIVEEEEMPMREEFIEKIIIGQLDVNLEEILGIQRNGREKYLDVTMKCQTYFKKLMVKYMENEEVHPVNKFKVRSMERDNYRLITLNMFDMNIPDVAVDLFLVDYVEIVSGPRYRRDRFGVFKEGVSFTDSELARVLTPYGNAEEDEEPEGMEEENNGGSEVVSVIGGSQVSEESVGLEMEVSEVESSEAEGYLGKNGVEGFKGVIGFTEEKKEGKEEMERKKKKEHE
ncbi:UNVERIFIED_CONTAM: hypothetical protein FKN15_071351 [Acipenser sinensis]